MLQFRTFGYRLRPWARGGCPEEQALVGWWALRWAALPVGGGVILISRINRIRGIYDIWWFKAAKAPGVSTSPHGALLRMLKVEWRMLNSHSSSLSLAGGRRACPALKPDAADQVLLKNRAGFAAFSKGRAFPSMSGTGSLRGGPGGGERRGHPDASGARAVRAYGWMAGSYCGRCRYHETSLRDLFR